MPDLQSEFNQCLYHSSSALHRWLGKMADEFFKAVELTPTQGFILITLKQAPGITIGDLSLVHQLDHSTITKTLDKMRLKGLVHREVIGRIVRVFATDHGKKKAADAKAAWRKLQLAYGAIIGGPKARAVADSIAETLDKLR